MYGTKISESEHSILVQGFGATIKIIKLTKIVLYILQQNLSFDTIDVFSMSSCIATRRTGP